MKYEDEDTDQPVFKHCLVGALFVCYLLKYILDILAKLKFLRFLTVCEAGFLASGGFCRLLISFANNPKCLTL